MHGCGDFRWDWTGHCGFGEFSNDLWIWYRSQETQASHVADCPGAAGVELLTMIQWLSNPYVGGIFMAPPCGTASRARSIPLKRKQSDQMDHDHCDQIDIQMDYPSFCSEKRLSSKLVKWAVATSCIFFFGCFCLSWLVLDFCCLLFFLAR